MLADDNWDKMEGSRRLVMGSKKSKYHRRIALKIFECRRSLGGESICIRNLLVATFVVLLLQTFVRQVRLRIVFFPTEIQKYLQDSGQHHIYNLP